MATSPSPHKSTAFTFVGSMIWSQVARVSEIGLGLVFTLVLVHWLPTRIYGSYATLLNLATSLTVFSSLGLSEGLLRYVPLGRQAQPQPYHFALLRRFLQVRLSFGIILALLLGLLREQLAGLFSVDSYSWQMWLVGLLLVSLGGLDLLLNFYIAMFRTAETVFIRASGQLLNLLIVGGWIIFASPSVAVVLLSTSFTTLLTAGFYLWRLPTSALQQVAPPGEIPIKEINGYSRTLWLVGLFTFGLGSGSDVLIMSAILHNPAQVAYYSVATLLITRLQSLSWGWYASLGSVAATVQVEKGYEGLVRYFGYYYKVNFGLNLFVVGYLALTANALVQVVFGKNYATSSAIVLVFLLSWLTIGFQGGGITYNFANVLGKHRWVLFWRLTLGLLNIVLDVVLVYWLGIWGAVIATNLCVFGIAAVEFLLLGNFVKGLPFGFILKFSVITVVAIGLGSLVVSNSLAGLIAASVVYGLVNLALLPVVRPLTEGDKQLLLHWKPRLQPILRFL